MSCSRAEHTIDCLTPSQLFREIMKRDYYQNPAFIGLSFTEEYVRVATSDDCHEWIHDEFPRDETLLENLVDAVQGIRNWYPSQNLYSLLKNFARNKMILINMVLKWDSSVPPDKSYFSNMFLRIISFGTNSFNNEYRF
ncbi:hypothetical protein QYF36_000284 [Acer negundo]|nr:hypothetical protein QYF36_000284 [Acer negundo]